MLKTNLSNKVKENNGELLSKEMCEEKEICHNNLNLGENTVREYENNEISDKEFINNKEDVKTSDDNIGEDSEDINVSEEEMVELCDDDEEVEKEPVIECEDNDTLEKELVKECEKEEELVKEPKNQFEDNQELEKEPKNQCEDNDTLEKELVNECEKEEELVKEPKNQCEDDETLEKELVKECDDDEELEKDSLEECMDNNDNELNNLFLHAKQLHNSGFGDKALQELLQCLKRATSGEPMNNVSGCLRMISEIYYKKNEFEKAVQFIQAEKMLYESNLMEIPEDTQDGLNKSDKMIHEFSNLSKLCEESEEMDLALEYQGKATKLCVDEYGYSHNDTTKHLDNFTNLYAKVGKIKYKDSSKRQHVKVKHPENVSHNLPANLDSKLTPNLAPKLGSNLGSNIILKRKKLNSKGQMVTFASSDQNMIHYIDSVRNEGCVAWFIIVLLFLVFTSIVTLVVFIYKQGYSLHNIAHMKQLAHDIQLHINNLKQRYWK